MAQFNALREGFRELNRMLIDKQQWDEKHEADKADRVYRDAILDSNLVQRQFENNMAKSRLLLAQEGAGREAERLSLTVADQKVRHENLQDQLDIKRANLTINQENSASLNRNRAKELVIKTSEAIEATRPYVAKEVNFEGHIPERLVTNRRFREEFSTLLATQHGAVMGDDLKPMIMSAEGPVPLKLKDAELKAMMPGVSGLLAKYNNPMDNAKIKIQELTLQKADLTKILGKDSTSKTDKGQAKRNIHKIEADLAKEVSKFQGNKPQKQYLNRSKEMYNSARWFRANFMEDLAKPMETAAFELLEKGTAVGKNGRGPDIPLYKKELSPKGKVESAGYTARVDPVTELWNYTDKEGNVIESPRLPDAVTNIKPTETFGKRDPNSLTGEMTTAQMVNFEKVFKEQGMEAMFASQEATAMKSTLTELTMANYSTVIGTKEGRAFARADALQFRKEQEVEFWSERAAIRELNPESLGKTIADAKTIVNILIKKAVTRKAPNNMIRFYKRALARITGAGNNITKAKKALETMPQIMMELNYRKKTGNPNMIVFSPNSTTKKMTFGMGVTGPIIK